jgi:hypothetical protein
MGNKKIKNEYEKPKYKMSYNMNNDDKKRHHEMES